MNPARGEWSDARIDDFYDEFKRLAIVVDGVGAMQVVLAQAAADAKHARAGVHRVRNDMNAQFLSLRNEMAAAATAAATERKSDKRWLIGTALTIAALLIAAGGILQGAL